jgi:hypothetical protein
VYAFGDETERKWARTNHRYRPDVHLDDFNGVHWCMCYRVGRSCDRKKREMHSSEKEEREIE